MYHTKLGYVKLDKTVVTLRSVRTLFAAFNNAPDFAVIEALKGVADIKSFVTAIKVPQFLQIGAHASFKPDSDAYNALYRLLVLNFQAEKLFDGELDYVTYVNDPVLRLSELVERATASEVCYISLNEDLSGDRTLWGAYVAEFCEWLHNIYRIGLDEVEFSQHIRVYRQHIVYKLSHNQLLQPVEKTFICNYYPGSPYADLQGWNETVQPAENSSPIVDRDFQRLVSLGEAGPISKYFKLLSNCSIEQLVAVLVPSVQSMPVLVGSLIPRGPATECDLTPLTTIPFTDDMELQGVRERLRAPIRADKADSSLDAQQQKWTLTPTLPATVLPVFAPLKNSGMPFDLEEVQIELRAQSGRSEVLDPAAPYAGLRASWHSAWRGRRVNTDDGATVDDLLTDLALVHKSYGSGAPIEVTLTPGAVIDRTEPSIRGRQVNFGTLTSSSVDPVLYSFYFQRNGQLEHVALDMRFYYSRRGATLIRPAFSEFIHPPKAMLYSPAEAAVSYVAAEVGLTEEERKVNALALTVCFNYAELRQLFARVPQIRDLQNFIRVLLAI